MMSSLRVEQAILDAELWGRVASRSDSEQPRRVDPWGDAGRLTNDSMCQPGPL